MEAEGVRLGIVNYLARVVAPRLAYGGLEVTRRSGRYRIAFSDLDVAIRPDRVLRIPRLVFWARPLGRGRYRIDRLSVPGPLSVRRPDGAPVGRAALVVRRFSGTFLAPAEAFLDLDLALDRAEVDLGPGRPAIAVEDLALALDSEPAGHGLWRQRGTAAARRLTARGRGGRRVEAADPVVEASVRDLRLAAYPRLLRRVGALAGALLDGRAAGTPVPEGGGDAILSGLEATLSLSDVVLRAPGGGDVEAALRDLGIRLALGGLDRPLVAGTLGLDYRDLASPAGGRLAGLPRSVSLDLSLENVPAARVADAYAAFAPPPAADEATRQAAEDRLVAAVMLELGTARTRIRLGPSKVDGGGMAIEAEGEARIDPAAAAGAVGALDARVIGYDGRAADGEGAPAPGPLGTALGFFRLLRGAAEHGVDGSGRSVDRLRFELTPSGGLLINGRALADLLVAAPPE